MSTGPRAVPDLDLGPLAKDEAVKQAAKAYGKARDAQADLVTNLHVSKDLVQPGKVGIGHLRLMRADAERQVKYARAVLSAVEDCIDVVERGLL